MRSDAKGVRNSFEKVQAILHRDWDPIGCGVPLDEYDSYAWIVLKLLQQGASRKKIADYLRGVAKLSIGMPVPEDRLAMVLDQLLGIAL